LKYALREVSDLFSPAGPTLQNDIQVMLMDVLCDTHASAKASLESFSGKALDAFEQSMRHFG
jgi:hypothetical protein